jgi:hypothetical protein
MNFRCPVCNGKMFGTSQIGSVSETGHCHDFLEDGSRCTFTWDRKQDDDKVFWPDFTVTNIMKRTATDAAQINAANELSKSVDDFLDELPIVDDKLWDKLTEVQLIYKKLMESSTNS